MSDENSTRCGGACCERFYLPFSPEELRRFADDDLHQRPGRRSFADDIQRIAGMVHLVERRPSLAGDGSFAHFYSCAYHDPVSGLCLIYSLRPAMCREYPYGRRCEFAACASQPWLRRCPFTRPLWNAVHRLRSWWENRKPLRKCLKLMEETDAELEQPHR